jgi:hypothetical protein
MPVNRHQLMNELELSCANDPDVADDVADVADMVVFHWQGLAQIELDAGYATGAYEASIHRESEQGRHPKGARNAAGKKIGGQFRWHSKAVTYSPIAHFIEYGTLPDDAPNYPKPPNAGGHWIDTEGEEHFWWNTPTRAYALAAQTALDFGGSAP